MSRCFNRPATCLKLSVLLGGGEAFVVSSTMGVISTISLQSDHHSVTTPDLRHALDERSLSKSALRLLKSCTIERSPQTSISDVFISKTNTI